MTVHGDDDDPVALEGGQAGPHDRIGAVEVRPRRTEARRPVDAARSEREAGALHLTPGVVGERRLPEDASEAPRMERRIGQSQCRFHPRCAVAHDGVDKAVLIGELGRVRALRQRLAGDELGHAWPGEADGRAGLGGAEIGERRI